MRCDACLYSQCKCTLYYNRHASICLQFCFPCVFSLPLFNFTPPRYVCVCSTLCAYALRGKKQVTTTSIAAARILLCTPMYRLWNKYYDICRTLLQKQQKKLTLKIKMKLFSFPRCCLPTTKTHIGSFFSCSANSKWNWNEQNQTKAATKVLQCLLPFRIV